MGRKFNSSVYLNWTLAALWGPVNFDSMIGCNIRTDSRMIYERQNIINTFLVEGKPDVSIRYLRQKYLELVGLRALFHNLPYKNNYLFKDWFKDNTTPKDWASFLKDYDIFKTWHHKEWSNKKIQKARYIFSMRPPFPNNI